ncbi:MAG TPA: hypothetical protein VMZ52_03525 [Bryobacteraceae bacterium]|nr:hypothetical protein [Bryobacteraceae bacterium]
MNRFFPQLHSGALVQFPVRKRMYERSIRNGLLDGSTVKKLDENASVTEWDLHYAGLTDGERAGIETLFTECGGRLESFLFLDPTDNLLRWSEDLEQTVWEKNPLLAASNSAPDPFHGTRGLRIENRATIAQGLSQTLNVPPALVYSFGAMLRSDTNTQVRLAISSGAMSSVTYAVAGDRWQLAVVSERFASGIEPVRFSIELDGGHAIELYGLQADAQPTISGYRKTTSQSGVYPITYFKDDVLEATATGINEHALDLRLTSRRGTL